MGGEQVTESKVRDWLRKRGFNFRVDHWVYEEGDILVELSKEAVERAECGGTALKLLIDVVNYQLA